LLLPLAAIWRRRHEIDGDVAAERVATEELVVFASMSSPPEVCRAVLQLGEFVNGGGRLVKLLPDVGGPPGKARLESRCHLRALG
jgi:hypothetical protein